MPHRHYDNVPVRDALAAERTLLAAERTLLAYLRSAFALFVTGVTGAQLLEAPWLVTVAHGLSVSSVVAFAVGGWRYARSRGAVLRLLARIAEGEP